MTKATRRLPRRILAVLLGIVVSFVAAVAVSGALMVRTFNGEMLAASERQVGHALEDMLERVGSTTLDYAKWNEAAIHVARRDVDWLTNNVGSSATVGEALQMAVIWGGPLEGDLGWIDDGIEAPRAGLLRPQDLVQAQAALAAVPLGSYEGATSFLRRGQDVFAVGTARIEAIDEEAQPPGPATPARAATLLLGIRAAAEQLHHVEDAFRLANVELVTQPVEGRPSLPLPGHDGRPVAFITWDPPRPGTALLVRMLPGAMGALLLALGLSGLGVALVRRNVRDLVLAERRASLAARTDGLTGLPNRTSFGEALAHAARPGERAVLFLDVNGFKRINDSIGHAAGDEVIVQVARRLGALAGPGCLLARISGDEFVFVISDADAAAVTARLVEAVRAALSEPFHVSGHVMEVRMAMGFAVQDAEGMTGEALVRQADLAMYEAKRRKGLDAVGFSALLEEASRDALRVERALRAALVSPGELSVAYQPIVDAQGGLVRAEALARWTSPELGSVPPDRFIGVAEQAGLIVELGRQLLQLVCRDLAAHPDLRVSVNVSPLQLMAPDFVPSLLAEVGRHGVAPARIEIELTEAVVVDDAALAAERLGELRAAGFSTALDDFGTGYSSVGYLGVMPFNTLKIDRSFVSGIHGSGKRLGLVNAMILMAHNLKLRVVCEGVETREELDLLRDLGCDLMQGYHLDRPLPIQILVGRWLPSEDQDAQVA